MNTKKAFVACLLMGVGPVLAAPTEYAFDTVTAVKLHASSGSVTGVLLNASTSTTVNFVDNTNVSYRYVVNRCVPVFLTALEKPGRYVLRVTVDTAVPNVQLISCQLELKD
jgi:hypothetical protein